jgi:hypothetical protein
MGSGIGTGPKPEVKQVDAGLSFLELALNRLGDCLDTLINRLEPALNTKPSPNPPNAPPPKEAGLCTLAAALADKTDIVNTFRDRIVSLLERLEI